MEIPYENVKIPWGAAGIKLYRWQNLKIGDVGQPLFWPLPGRRSLQVYGTFGLGGSLEIQGSNFAEPTENDFVPLRDSRGGANRLCFSAGSGMDIQEILQLTCFIRPKVVGGDETSNFSVFILVSGR